MTTQESADKERQRQNRRNAARQAEFADFDAPSPQILKDPELATAWVIDWSKTTPEMSKLCRLDEEMLKYDGEWSLSETTIFAASGKSRHPSPLPTAAMVATTLHAVQEEAGRIIRERQH